MQQKVLVGTDDGLHELGNGGDVRVAGHEVGALAGDEKGWWAILDGREVWRSAGDNMWARAAAVESLRANCLLKTEAGLFVGTSEAHMYMLRGDALEPLLPFDEADGRESWYTPWGGPPDVRTMSSDPSGTIYANVHVGGVVRSTDGGESWEPTMDIHADVHQVLFDTGSGKVFAASARGLAVSDDGGESWRFDTDGLHAGYCRAVAVAKDTVLVTASTGPSTNRAALYRRPLGSDGPFRRCQEGLPEWFSSNIDTMCLAASGSFVAFGTSEGTVFASSDKGESWTLAAEGLPSVRCVAITTASFAPPLARR